MRILTFVVGLGLLSTSCRHSQGPNIGGDAALQRGAWADAVADYDRVLFGPKTVAGRDAILFRRVVALLASGGAADLAKARGTLQELVRDHPKSLWSAQGRALMAHLDAIEATIRALEHAQAQRKSLVAQVALAEEKNSVCEAALTDIDKDRQQRDQRLAELEDTVIDQRATLVALKKSVGRLQRQLDALKRIDLGAQPP